MGNVNCVSFFFSLNSVLYASLHIPIHTHTQCTDTSPAVQSQTHIFPSIHIIPAASVHVCPVPVPEEARLGARGAAGGAAWPGGGVGPGTCEEKVQGGEGSLVGRGERRGSRPAEKTCPGALEAQEGHGVNGVELVM